MFILLAVGALLSGLAGDPDYLVYRPAQVADAYNDHFQVIWDDVRRLYYAFWTQATREGAPDMRIVFSKSADRGKTWTVPKTLAGTPMDGSPRPRSVWQQPMLAKGGRLYCLWNQQASAEALHHGLVYGRYSDDAGETWSEPEENRSIPRQPMDDPTGVQLPNWCNWQRPIRVGEGGRFMAGCTRHVKPADVETSPGRPIGSWVEFWQYENIDENPEIRDVRITVLNGGEKSLSIPIPGTDRFCCEEASLVKLPDGRLFALVRSRARHPFWSVSDDGGRTWTVPKPLKDRAGRAFLQPNSPCPMYDFGGCESGSGAIFALIHDAYDDSVPPLGRQTRGPLYFLHGTFDPKSEQPVSFEKEGVFLPLEADNSCYSSYTVADGERVLWFGLRKHELVGKRVDDLNARIAAVAESGGGKVSVSGVTRMEGPLELKSGVELRLEDGAEIVFSGDPKCYPIVTSSYEGLDRKRPCALVTARDAKDVAITGKGTFRANVDYWHSVEGYRNPRPQFFQFSGCRNLRLEGFRIRESPSWTIHVFDTKDVVIRDLDVIAHGRNTDGIDIDSAENVLIENCRLDQGDDGFVMKSGKNAEGRRRGKPTRNVMIRNCTVVNGHTLLGIGSELSGGIENVRLEDCTVEGEVWRVLLVKTNPARGGYARDIHVKNVKAARAKCAIFEIMEDYFWWRDRKTNPEIVRTAISDISVENVVCDEAWYAYDLRGDAALKPRDIAFRNCTVKNPLRDVGRAENVENLTVENVTAKTGPVTVWCDDADARYRCGDTATFTVHAQTDCTAHIRLDNFGDKVIRECDVQLEKGRDFTVTGGRDIPGFLLLTVKVGKTTVRWGAAFDPEKITAGAACPDDFDAFWREAIANYDRKVPVDVKLEPLPQLSTNGCAVSLVSLSDPKGRTVYGFLSMPKDTSKGPYPVCVHVPGAGPSVGGAQVGDRKTIGLTMNVHYWRPVPGEAKRGKVHNALQVREDAAWQERYPAGRPRYTVSGIAESREDYFYYGAILAINRVVCWLRARPEAKSDDFRYTGGSQGGGMGLALAALNGGFRKVSIAVPALTAHFCQDIDGRESGWPRLIEAQLPENRAAAKKNASYFDGVNFASRITCPIRFSVGFTDTVAPPHAGYAAFNACPSKDKAMVDSVGFGHANSGVDTGRNRKWLEE